ncbi:hypothetical protein F4604DRAFT_1794324 [Suillus subluteus]|nr:hypothetical protein F4604DRAFT_1794324 [Suillus subluteus]
MYSELYICFICFLIYFTHLILLIMVCFHYPAATSMLMPGWVLMCIAFFELSESTEMLVGRLSAPLGACWRDKSI